MKTLRTLLPLASTLAVLSSATMIQSPANAAEIESIPLTAGGEFEV